MIDNDFIKKHTLLECLQEFKGAQSYDGKSRLECVTEEFGLLAKKFLYGGYLMVGNDYRIDISIVEFYYHEEKKDNKNGIYDYIVYHRNGRYPGNPVPPFQTMSIHAHPSGYDITFEDPDGKYRASALIREYTVKNCHTGKYIKWNPKDNGDGYYEESSEDIIYDDRSQNLYYYLNGFELNGNGNEIRWESIEDVPYDTCKIYRGHRKNVFEQNKNGIIIKDDEVTLDEKKEWAFSKRENTEIIHSRNKSKNCNRFSKKERYGIEHGQFI
jgi:hypothetical protein